MSLQGGTLADWTAADIARECRTAYGSYGRRREEQYRRYFRDRPGLAGSHPLLARDLESALPPGWEGLAALLPQRQRHRWVLSGRSSQALALGLLGPAMELQPSGDWLGLLGTAPPAAPPRMRLEVDLPPALLDEHPRTTAVDFLAEGAEWVLCCEAKWTETGMGTCSCTKATTPLSIHCSDRVLERTAYWTAARDIFDLPARQADRPCPLHASYQAVRNVAAALALAGPDRSAVFCLLYDGDNPFFAGHGRWPGWAAMLERSLDGAHPALAFCAATWQEVVPRLPLDIQVREWARDKHHLLASSSSTSHAAH